MRSDRLGLVRGIALRTVLLLGVLFAGSRLVAPVVLAIPSGELQIRVVPRLPGGRLIVPLGPLGKISWRVDRAPLDIEANLLIDAKATALPDADDIDLGRLRSEFLRTKLLWVLLFGMAAGLLAVQGTGVRRAVAAAGGAAAALGVVTFLAALTVLTFDENRLADPRYQGPVRDVPRIVQLIKEIRRDFPGAKRNIAEAVEGLARLRRELLAGEPRSDEPTIRLLLVSDLHNNPVGLLIAERLVKEFAVAGVLDAGDFSERGTAIEGELFARFGSLGVPYVIAPGNHEDDAALQRVSQIPNVTVLGEQKTATVEGLTIAGAEDPNARVIDADPRNDRADRLVPELCESLRSRAAGASIVLVHDPRIGECAAADAEAAVRSLVFAWGHLHKPVFQERGSVVSVSPGTSGAAGIKTSKDRPYGFALLEFDRATKLPLSVCLFAFDRPQELGDASCHVLPRAAA